MKLGDFLRVAALNGFVGDVENRQLNERRDDLRPAVGVFGGEVRERGKSEFAPFANERQLLHFSRFRVDADELDAANRGRFVEILEEAAPDFLLRLRVRQARLKFEPTNKRDERRDADQRRFQDFVFRIFSGHSRFFRRGRRRFICSKRTAGSVI